MSNAIRKYIAILFFLFSFNQCITTENYKLSEILPAYSKYEGKKLDPLTEKPIGKPSSQLPKYDEYLENSKRIIVKLRLVSKYLKTDHEKLELSSVDRLNLYKEFATDLPKLKTEIDILVEQGKKLSMEAKDDFVGPKAIRLPHLLSDLSSTVKDLGEFSGELTNLLNYLKSSDSTEFANLENDNTTEKIPSLDGNNSKQSMDNSKEYKSQKLISKNINEKGSDNLIPEYSNSQMTENRILPGIEKLTTFQNYLSSRKKN
ncbi:hypothetical protein ND861_11545 [Leptospira sp. 2 VSF19]|uniref:Lipoprotein n=1 Tax=Leptospira soteropolitanensis TaxID=2950025 RepID=A0ABT3MJB0_9LEPT|nr:hypothetical protein [Leptospira soteropolitanensis]MCW7493061.1 hypothetical protein [Leptospira soteropolitanensis]MCW7526982.1 hypothetical protein [Leptospira soteropolitanensis]